MADLTGLGLDGLPRSGDLFDEFAAVGSVRPDSSQYLELGLDGLPRIVEDFDPKAAGALAPRPYVDFTELGLDGLPGEVNVYTAKNATRGMSGRPSIGVTMSSTLKLRRRYNSTTSVTTGIRTIGSIITFAHKISVAGTNKVVSTPQASRLKYTRAGQNAAINGANSVGTVPFGNMKYRPRRFCTSTIQQAVTPKSTLRYTPAPIKNATFTGRPRIAITPASPVTFHAGGTPYSFSGHAGVNTLMSGRVMVVRQTTYAFTGRTTTKLTPNSAVTHGTGAPRNYSLNSNISVTVQPTASFMGLVTGANQQNHIDARPRLSVKTSSLIRVYRAPTIPVLPGSGGKRRFIRIFR